MNLTRSQRRTVLAELIRTHMIAHGVTQVQLAEIFDVSESQMSRRCNGLAPWPAEDLSILADLFEAPITFPPTRLTLASG